VLRAVKEPLLAAVAERPEAEHKAARSSFPFPPANRRAEGKGVHKGDTTLSLTGVLERRPPCQGSRAALAGCRLHPTL
jgi:hypothetical protein